MEDRFRGLIKWLPTPEEATGWFQAGQLLGQSLWTVWCPIPEGYEKHLPKSYQELRDSEVIELPDYASLWKGFLGIGGSNLKKLLEDVFNYPQLCGHWRDYLILAITQIAEAQVENLRTEMIETQEREESKLQGESQAEPSARTGTKGRKPGRNKISGKNEKKRYEILQEWESVKGNRSRKDFCVDKGITVKQLENFQRWKQQRENRGE